MRSNKLSNIIYAELNNSVPFDGVLMCYPCDGWKEGSTEYVKKDLLDRIIQAIKHANNGLIDYEGVSLVWAMGGAMGIEFDNNEYKESIRIIKEITGDDE